MKKTVWPKFKDVVEDMEKLSRDLKDIKTILACICWHQSDRKLQVSFFDLDTMPEDMELEISVDRANNQYVFTAISPSKDLACPPSPAP